MRALLVGVLMLLVGCGTWKINLYKGISTTALAASGCTKVVVSVNDGRQASVRLLAKADPDAAQKKLDAWKHDRDEVLMGCEIADTLAAEAHRLAPALDSKSAAVWITKLTAVALDVARLLTEHGMKLPGGYP